jgi:phosphohistidine phosphatase
MELLIFRHGPAGDRDKWAAAGKNDAVRPLTAEGEEKTAKAAAGLAVLVPALDAIAASPLVRAKQTADALAAEFPNAERLELKELEPSAEPARFIAKLAGMGAKSRLALVGHEPHLTTLAAALLGAKPGALELKKAGALLLHVTRPKEGGARLLWLLRPSQLRALR